MNVEKTKTRGLIQNSFLAYLVEQGFGLDQNIHPATDVNIFPFGVIKRKRDNKYDLVEVQFDKSGRNKFVFNFGVSDASGVTTPWGSYIDIDSVSASELPVYYRFHSSKLFDRWFVSPKSGNLAEFSETMLSVGEAVNNWFLGGQLPKNAKRMGFQ